MNSIIHWTIGDSLPKVEATLKDRNGVVNLTGASVRFVSNMGIDDAAVIVDAAGGRVEYTPLPDDVKVGRWLARFVVDFPGANNVLSFPNSDPYLIVEVGGFDG